MLEHVGYITANGIKYISIEEACKLYPHKGISSDDGYFVCLSCGHTVCLTSPSPYVTRHFKHSRADEDKDCEDRSIAYSHSVYHGIHPNSINFNNLPFPFRLKVSESNVDLQIGLYALPVDVLDKVSRDHFTIKGKGIDYEYSASRLSPYHTTYFSVGNNVCESYLLIQENKQSILSRYYPVRIPGISDEYGAFFDAETGVKIPYEGHIREKKAYYFLTREKLYCRSSYGVTVNRIASVRKDKSTEYFIYKVRADRIMRSSILFFLKYRVYLTRIPIGIRSIWPPCIETSHMIYHDAERIFLMLQGQDEIIPYICPGSQVCRNESIVDGYKLLTASSGRAQQLIAYGDQGVDGFKCISRNPISLPETVPLVNVFKNATGDTQASENGVIPYSKALYFNVEYDGFCRIRRDGVLRDEIVFKADEIYSIKDLAKTDSLEFYVGFDLIAKYCFVDKRALKNSENNRRDLLLKELQLCGPPYMRVGRSLSVLAKVMKQDKDIYMWLQQQLKKGKISKKAMSLLLAEVRGVLR